MNVKEFINKYNNENDTIQIFINDNEEGTEEMTINEAITQYGKLEVLSSCHINQPYPTTQLTVKK